MLQPGSQIGRYEIQRRLGRGGMGAVYVAHDPVLGRMVAVKVFAADLDLPDAAQRFAREARSAAALNHPYIVTVHDYGDVSSQPFIVMEYVQGETVADIIRRRAAVPVTEKLRWMEELCAGVAYAHRNGVIHRDLKPTNLMVTRAGQLKILDFGIARMLGTLAPKATALVGTPGYMAPEQILGASLDHRGDLFSIGVVCYELVSYAEAFPGDTLPTITHRILTQEPLPLTQLVPGIHPDLADLVARALRKDPAERFEDAEAMRAALARVRRQIEEGGTPPEAVPATLLVDRPAAGGFSRRGTDGARPASDPVGAQGTPPPDAHRVDRELLAKRRTAQIEACLERSRSLLEAGDPDSALDACVQALTLEETHPGALALEETIQGALAARRAEALLGEAREELGRQSLTAAQGLLQQVRDIDPENAELKRLDRDLRLARVEETRRRQRAEALAAAVANAESALARGEVEMALVLSRDALMLDPSSERARAIEAEALRRLDEDTLPPSPPRPDTNVATLVSGPVESGAAPTVLRRVGDVAVIDPAQTMIARDRRTPLPPPVVPASAGVATPAAQPGVVAPAAEKAVAAPAPASRAPGSRGGVAKPSGGDVARRARAAAAAGVAAMRGRAAAVSKTQRLAMVGVAVGVVLIASIGYLLTPGVVPSGSVTIDAAPWATVTRIVGSDGTEHPLPVPADTPLSLTLPAGAYTLTLTGPAPAAETRELSVTVAADQVVTLPAEKFQAMTPDEYFSRYLESPADLTESASATPADSTVPAAAPPLPAAPSPSAVSPAAAAPSPGGIGVEPAPQGGGR